MKRTFTLSFFFFPLLLLAQKKPLDHTVYDGWQSVGEKLISNDGKWIVYAITPQEGDAELWIRSTAGNYTRSFPRGYNAVITEDNRFAVFKIKPPYKDTREARIKKKRPDELPKDSIAIVELGRDSVKKVAKIKGYKTPEKAGTWLAYQKEREAAGPRDRTGSTATMKTVDSLKRTIDSLQILVKEIKNVKSGSRDAPDAEDDPVAGAGAPGSDLVLRQLITGKEKTFRNVVDYYFNANGNKLVMRVSKSPGDSNGANAVVIYDLDKSRLDTILKGGADFKGFALTDDGSKIAFVADRDTNSKALQKFYGIYLYGPGADSAKLLVDKKTEGMRLGTTVSENGRVYFSESGQRLFFGTAPIQPAKDTTLIDIDLVKLDIWHYKDDYLQTQQLNTLQADLKRSYPAMYDFNTNSFQQLGSKDLPTVILTASGDGAYFIGITDTGRRVEAQWMSGTRKDVYALNTKTGEKTLVRKNLSGQTYASATGKYILLYDDKAKAYLAWDGKGLKNISAGIQYPVYNEENDVPDDPNAYGVMGWHQGDSAVYIYDRYDVWKVDPAGKVPPAALSAGRSSKISYRYLSADRESSGPTAGRGGGRFNRDVTVIKSDSVIYFKAFNQETKTAGITYSTIKRATSSYLLPLAAAAYNSLQKAQDVPVFLFTKETYTASPDLYVASLNGTAAPKTDQLTAINPQQAGYNWGTAELYKWKTFDGKAATGILYKPENFDSSKKYPLLMYFYEKLSDGLYNYLAPSPTPSRLNIPFFVSRGYLVLAPDISYTKGHPGKDAYNYVVSGAQALAKRKWVDRKNIGIQGQSWGGYQVAYLITATPMFKAAWAGAPVVNMFSAYGGIRWESGNNRQGQYEHGQSRIGATPWEHPELYIENSPLFHLPKVTTPLVIMSNDADGAVPWYQGIEFFTAMRRLGKKVWLLNYNGEAHNLVDRRARKDIQIREQEYFDWLLKGEKPARWITEGLPAVQKGKQWALEIVE